MTKSKTTKEDQKNSTPGKKQYSSRQIWQGREDADMLQEKQTGWHCRPDSNNDFGDDDVI